MGRSRLGHLIHLLIVGLAKNLGAISVGAVSGEVTILLTSKTWTIVKGVLVRGRRIRRFRFALTGKGLCQRWGRNRVLRGCWIVRLRRHDMRLRNLSRLQLLQRLTILVVGDEWRLISVGTTRTQILLSGESNLFHSRRILKVVFVSIHGGQRLAKVLVTNSFDEAL